MALVIGGIFLILFVVLSLHLILKGFKYELGALKKMSEETKLKVDSFINRQIEDITKIKSDIIRDIEEQRVIVEDIKKTKETIIRLESEYNARRQEESKAWNRLEKLENIIAGTQTKGQAGEAIVFEQLSKFPSDMMDSRFSPGFNKEVEYALVLPDQKRLPIDAKFPTEVLQRAQELEGQGQIETARSHIEETIKRKVKEVSGYINPSVTTDIAICAIPDGMYRYCSGILSSAYRYSRVIIVPYSMLIPFLLVFYRLYLVQFQTRSLDLQRFLSQITNLDKKVDDMSLILKNSIDRAVSMLINASSELRDHLSGLKTALAHIPTVEVKEKSINSPQGLDKKIP
ncbi:MAG: DNA recombination protein RmuC [Candidatus Omnitrophica bacterium]|nr:DNA recombination protein RmuC [Candidatus Omnitrophota bacterium]